MELLFVRNTVVDVRVVACSVTIVIRRDVLVKCAGIHNQSRLLAMLKTIPSAPGFSTACSVLLKSHTMIGNYDLRLTSSQILLNCHTYPLCRGRQMQQKLLPVFSRKLTFGPLMDSAWCLLNLSVQVVLLCFSRKLLR